MRDPSNIDKPDSRGPNVENTRMLSIQNLNPSCNLKTPRISNADIYIFASKLTCLVLTDILLLEIPMYAKIVAITPGVNDLTIKSSAFCPDDINQKPNIAHVALNSLYFGMRSDLRTQENIMLTAWVFNCLTSQSPSHLRELTIRYSSNVRQFWEPYNPTINPLPTVQKLRIIQHILKPKALWIGSFAKLLLCFPNIMELDFCYEWDPILLNKLHLDRKREQGLRKHEGIGPGEIGTHAAKLFSFIPSLNKLRSFTIRHATMEHQDFLQGFEAARLLHAGGTYALNGVDLIQLLAVEGKETMEYHLTVEGVSCTIVGVWKLPFSDLEKQRLSHLVRDRSRYIMKSHCSSVLSRCSQQHLGIIM
jgi:hypothetical protein